MLNCSPFCETTTSRPQRTHTRSCSQTLFLCWYVIHLFFNLDDINLILVQVKSRAGDEEIFARPGPKTTHPSPTPQNERLRISAKTSILSPHRSTSTSTIRVHWTVFYHRCLDWMMDNKLKKKIIIWFVEQKIRSWILLVLYIWWRCKWRSCIPAPQLISW